MDDKTGAVDLAMDPTNPRVLYAAAWQAQRTPWSLESGGPGSGLYKTTDGGDTWKKLDGKGLPKGPWGRIGVSVSPARSDRVYAMIEAEDGGVFRSDDAGATWERTNEDRKLRQRAWYYTHVVADPKEPDTVYVLNVQLFRSKDGGKTFETIRRPARRQPRPVDRPGGPAPDDRGQRRRGRGHLRRGPQLVERREPADRAVLPRDRGRPVPLPGLRRAAGQLDGGDREPHRPLRHRRARLARRRRAARAATSRRSRATPT